MKYAIVLYLSVLLPLFAASQSVAYHVSVTSFSEKDGLSNNNVFCIAKDARNILWLGTRYGLNRFDGQHFKKFTVEQGMHSNTVYQIWQDADRLWLFYKPALDGEVTYIDILDTHSERILPLEKVFHKMPFKWKQVKRCELQKDAVFFQLNDTEYFVYTTKKGFQKHRFPKEERLHACTASGEFWLTQQQGEAIYLIKRTANGKFINRRKLPYSSTDFLILHETANGTTYFCNIFPVNKDKTFYLILKIDAQHQKMDTLILQHQQKELASYPLFIPKFQLFWLAENTKLSAFNTAGKQTFHADKLVNNINPLFRQSLVTGNLIFQPTTQEGFYLIELHETHFQNLFSDASQPQSFRGIVQRNDEFFYNTEAGVLKVAPNQSTTLLPLGAVASMLNKNGIWWGGKFGFAWSYDKNGNIKRYSSPYNDPWSIYEDGDNILISQEGLYYFNPTTRAIFPPDYGKFEELKKHIIYHFHELETNKLLLCTTAGLYELDRRQHKIVARYWSGGKGKYYLPTDDFRHLFFDKKDNTFWLATGQNGLLRWQPKKQQTTFFKFGESLTNIIHCVYADDFGFLWLSTDYGIVQFHKKTHQFKIYTKQDGLATNEFNRVSHLKDKQGRLHFGSINGIAIFHPKDFQQNFLKKENPQPFVVEVEQYIGKTQRIENTTDFLRQNNYISIQPNDRFLYLTLGLNEWRWTTEAVYFYKIKGEKMDWIPIERNRLTIGQLPYGWQTLEIKTRLSNGQFSTKTLEVILLLHRPFYQQWWFILLIIASAAALVVWRIRELAQMNIRLNNEVAERTQTITAQTAELRQLDEMKSRFFANISHELRTPLTLIASPLQRLMKQETDPEKRQSLHFATKNSQRLLRLVNEILDLTKLEATKLTLIPQNVQVMPFTRRVLAEFESFAAHRGIALLLDANLSDAATAFFDLKKVETVLYNLLSNALKFTPEGGTVTLQVTLKNEGVCFQVTDTGRGILHEDLPHIFDRFYQSKKQSTAEGGTGIGLAICKEFAALMDGNITAESEWNKGTTIRFWLPTSITFPEIVPTETTETETSNARKPERPQVKNPNLTSLLIVEDNEDLQQYLSVLLQKNYHLNIVNNGKAALDFMQTCETKDRPALILSDIMMPEMDGFQLLKHLKTSTEYRQIPVIMLTARASNDDRLKALRIGVDDYLTKPFLEEELLARIDNLLRNAAVRKEEQQENPLPSEEGFPLEQLETWLQELENLIKNNLHEPTFSVDFLAERLGYSRQTLNKHLKTSVGLTTTEYIKEVRLNVAREQLAANPNLTVKQVAEAIGASNVKYFSKQFKERFGIFPSEI